MKTAKMKLPARRSIWIITLSLLPVIFVWTKWDSWFYNPPEPNYVASALPNRMVMTWSGNPFENREISWQGSQTNQMGSLQLISLSNPSDTTRLKATPKLVHTAGGTTAFFKVSLNGLKPGEAYQYRVANDSSWSPWYPFKMGDPQANQFSFVFIGDVQDSVGGISGKLFHRAAASRPNAAFMMFIGDMIERPHDVYWNEWFRAGGDLFRTLPVIATPGNHEYHKGLIQKIDERWTACFPFPQNGPPHFLGRACYWDYLNTRFISFDTNGIQSPFSAYEQRSWLKEVLQNTHKRWIVVMMHHPIYSTSRGRDYFYLRALFKPLFDEYHVDLVLAGHDHSYGRGAHIAAGNSKEQGAVYLVTHASPKLYDLGFPKQMDRLASNQQMYQLFDIAADSIRCQTFTADSTYFDGFTIHKDSRGVRNVTEQAMLNDPHNLQPTANFLHKSSSKAKASYQKEMEEWIEKANHH